ncbi:MAG: hypothetical protein M3082_15005 [Candidatus Dormibacteraeota bacterium]|nr:hypothetical protein [Candidatus Dormibacteraeota bacterium]
MTLFRRLFLVVSIVVTGSLGLAAAAIAAGGGGGLPPGNYTFKDTGAFAAFGVPVTPTGPPQFIIAVDRSHSDFRPKSGPHQVYDTTTVVIQISTAKINGFGCFTIPSSDFTVSANLQSASLHTTLTTPCGPPPPPGTGSVASSVPALHQPLAGGGGGGLPASIALDITWSGNGVIGTTSDKGTFNCAGYTLDRKLFGHSASVTGSGSVSAPTTGVLLPTSPADQGTGLRTTATYMNVTNVEQAACLPLQLI